MLACLLVISSRFTVGQVAVVEADPYLKDSIAQNLYGSDVLKNFLQVKISADGDSLFQVASLSVIRGELSVHAVFLVAFRWETQDKSANMWGVTSHYSLGHMHTATLYKSPAKNPLHV